jgi:hypothetical protein
MLEIKKEYEKTIEFPIRGRIYNVITNQGNIYRRLYFVGYSNGVAKPQYIFKELNGTRVSINPSYQVEMCETDIPDNIV